MEIIFGNNICPCNFNGFVIETINCFGCMGFNFQGKQIMVILRSGKSDCSAITSSNIY